ncbi:MAG: CpsD/CapB family tyrosine-protein kinase [Sphingomonas bacterium]|nr:CpsD/CapB family tyrosine-protein kinase [Sphingomonas bacterium]
MLSPADRQSFAWDFAIAKARGIYGFDALDARSRSFNMVRARLMELKVQRGWRLFGVVSATPNVGKSFIAANIAASLSREPSLHTFAVDLDLRRATLSAMFGIDPKVSLSSYLADEPGANAPSAYQLDNENLTVVATTAAAIRSAELVAGNRAHAILHELRNLGDDNMAIVDLPPVFANDDAITVMSRLDAYIMVAEEGKTRQRELQDAISLLGVERLAGVILNKYRGGMISEGYGFDSYYADGYPSSVTED